MLLEPYSEKQVVVLPTKRRKIPGDVKETYYYIHMDGKSIGHLYIRAVDRILEGGLSMNMAEGQYFIKEEAISYTEV